MTGVGVVINDLRPIATSPFFADPFLPLSLVLFRAATEGTERSSYVPFEKKENKNKEQCKKRHGHFSRCK